MRQILFKIAICLLPAFSFIACNNFLDIQPEDKLTEKQVFSTEYGINNSLNGIYMGIATTTLYGSNLTMTTLDVMAQRYSVASNNSTYYPFSTPTSASAPFDDKAAKDRFSSIWSEYYKQILSINNFIDQVTKTKVITQEKKNILLGEAYGLRAFLHFDILRLYGPVYKIDSVKVAIPYSETCSAETTPLLPATEVVRKVLKDLSEAESLLQNDPVKTQGVITTSTNDIYEDFYLFRNRRFNYFAVKALQARVNLYKNDKDAALNAAKSVIQASSGIFPWTTYNDIILNKTNPDRCFSTEIIFGVHNQSMYSVYLANFSPSLSTYILAPLTARLNAVYESTDATPTADYRFTPNWVFAGEGGKSYRTFFKFAQPADITKVTFGYFQPLVRISEMYYIAAECEPDKATALGYLNTVRYNRGLVDLAPTATVQAEIQKEYQKEFYGEGQLFYYYKRMYITAIPNGNSTNNISMNSVRYVVPIPDSEKLYR